MDWLNLTAWRDACGILMNVTVLCIKMVWGLLLLAREVWPSACVAGRGWGGVWGGPRLWSVCPRVWIPPDHQYSSASTSTVANTDVTTGKEVSSTLFPYGWHTPTHDEPTNVPAHASLWPTHDASWLNATHVSNKHGSPATTGPSGWLPATHTTATPDANDQRTFHLPLHDPGTSYHHAQPSCAHLHSLDCLDDTVCSVLFAWTAYAITD